MPLCDTGSDIDLEIGTDGAECVVTIGGVNYGVTIAAEPVGAQLAFSHDLRQGRRRYLHHHGSVIGPDQRLGGLASPSSHASRSSGFRIAGMALGWIAPTISLGGQVAKA